MFNSYIEYHINLVNKLNAQIENSTSNVYLFGAHIFSQYLFVLLNTFYLQEKFQLLLK